MSSLDQPIADGLTKTKNYIIDLIFIGLMIFLALVRDLAGIFAVEEMMMIVGTAVMICYLIGYWWLNKPVTRSGRNILFTLLYGFALFASSSALLFNLLYLSGGRELTLIACLLTALVVVIDLILFAFTKTRTINTATALRLSLLTSLIIILYVVPESVRVKFTYRKHPEFIELYDAKKTTVPFVYIVEEYEKTHDL